MVYRLYPGGVINQEADAFIPENEHNRDWQIFQAWLAEGNEAEPWKTSEEMFSEARNNALRKIDEQAEAERQKVITPGAGQAMTYLRKEQEARAAINEAEPAPSRYPILTASLAAELGIDTETVIPQGVKNMAIEVVFRADQWAQRAAQIEEIRISAKRKIAAAETPEEIASILQGIIWS